MQVEGANYTETIEVPKKRNFTIAKRSPSGFSKDGGMTRIDSPKYKNILCQDRCILSKDIVNYFNEMWGSEYLKVTDEGEVFAPNKVYIGTIGTVAHKRYVKGQNVIWKTEQEKLGIKPGANDEIVMVWGDFNVDATAKPTDKGLLVFLLTHNQNEDNPHRDNAIAGGSFKIQDNKRNASKDIEETQDKIQEAREIVYEVRDKSTKRFRKDKIDFYTNVFRTQISGYDSDEEKFRALLTIADTNPDVIIKGINKESVNYLQVVQQAIGLDILVKERGKYLNTHTKNTVVSFKVGTSDSEAIEKMVDYYASKDGAAEYEHLKNSVEAIKNSRIQ